MSLCFHHEWTNSEGRLRAIPHRTTTNTSFLRTCALLRKMGIKNYAFPLCLYDPDLLHVDPHNLEDNTPDNEILRIKVMKEARRNVWYYLREVVKIYEQGGDPIPFRLDRGNMAMTWCFLNGLDYWGMQPRQTGKTVCAITLSAWIVYVHAKSYNFGMMAKDNDLRRENVDRVKRIRDALPSWWISTSPEDQNNMEGLYYHAFQTRYSTMVAQTSEALADLKARGASFSALHIDEVAYCSNINISYPTMLSSTDKARENAKKNGQPHSNILTTTAGDPTKAEARAAAEILDGAMPFSEFLYDQPDRETLHKVVEAASPQKMINGTFSHQMLGLPNEWLREKIARSKASPDKIMRDYLNKWVSIADNPVIPKNILNLINSSQIDPVYLQPREDRFVIYWYKPKEVIESPEFKQKSIVVGCDSSELIGRDMTTLVGVDPTDLSVVFTWRCVEGNINHVGTLIASLLLEYPKMVFIPENKSSGTAIIDHVSLILRQQSYNPFTRIYNQVINNQDEIEFTKINYRDTSLLDTKVKRLFGFKTDKSKRDELYGQVLIEAASKSAKNVRDRTLVAELNALTATNGRIDHAVGSHDDTVIAWLLALWLILRGKHLHLYGIQPNTVLSRLDTANPSKSIVSDQMQAEIRARIEDLEDRLKSQRDPALQRHIRADLTLLHSYLTNAPLPTPTTTDQLIRDPNKYTDIQTARESRPPVDFDTSINAARAMMRI